MTRVVLAAESDFTGWRSWARSLLQQKVPARDIHWEIAPQTSSYDYYETPLPQASSPFTISPALRALIAGIFASGHPERFSLLYQLLEYVRDHDTLPQDIPLYASGKEVALQARREAITLRKHLPPSSHSELVIQRLSVPVSLLDSQAQALCALRPHPWLIHTPGRVYLFENNHLFLGPSPKDQDILHHDQALLRYARENTCAAPHHPLWKRILPLSVLPSPHLIEKAPSLDALRAYAVDCMLCPLCQAASRTVFGEGNPNASILFVGEQPGDQEDLQGRPFVGPAGQLFDQALRDIGKERSHYWISNAVKHFRFFPKSGRRIHQKPDAPHIQACAPWLAAERRLIRPKVTVMLGVTGASAILGRTVRVMRERSHLFTLPDNSIGLITVHPSSLLRQPDDQTRQQEYAKFTADLNLAFSALA